MGFFELLKTEAEKRRLEFLVIGGFAVNFYGYSRDTADVDILVLRDASPAWIALFAGLGYTVLRDAGTFIQFAPPRQGDWPVDLMLVRQESFVPMLSESHEAEMYGVQVRIPRLEHLIALKLHALKHTRVHRFLKDFQDVEGLVRVNHLDLQSEKIRQLFLKYGTLDLYEKVVRACANE